MIYRFQPPNHNKEQTVAERYMASETNIGGLGLDNLVVNEGFGFCNRFLTRVSIIGLRCINLAKKW